ncbi:unnamed protein product [Amoebophrya sp. A120]|nr:unnamed protein product [Amoebophrya sp. A120]|eukprot:GSA120T00016996001.1
MDAALLLSRNHLDEAIFRTRTQLDEANWKTRELLDRGLSQNRQFFDEAVVHARVLLDTAIAGTVYSTTSSPDLDGGDENKKDINSYGAGSGAPVADLAKFKKDVNTFKETDNAASTLENYDDIAALLQQAVSAVQVPFGEQATRVAVAGEMSSSSSSSDSDAGRGPGYYHDYHHHYAADSSALGHYGFHSDQPNYAQIIHQGSYYAAAAGAAHGYGSQPQEYQIHGSEENREYQTRRLRGSAAEIEEASSPLEDSAASELDNKGDAATVPVMISKVSASGEEVVLSSRNKAALAAATEGQDKSVSSSSRQAANTTTTSALKEATEGRSSSGTDVVDIKEPPSNMTAAKPKDGEKKLDQEEPSLKGDKEEMAKAKPEVEPPQSTSSTKPRQELAANSNYVVTKQATTSNVDPPPLPPFLISHLAGVSKLPLGKWGFAGWYQSSIDSNLLNDTTISPKDKLEQLFGIRLAWDRSQFPKVPVTKVAENSCAAKNGIVSGDFLVAFSGEKIGNVKSLPGFTEAAPELAIVEKVQRAEARLKKSGNYGKENLCGFIFLRKKYADQYLQLGMTIPTTTSGGENEKFLAEKTLGFDVISYKSNSLEMEILQVGKISTTDATSFAVQNKLQEKDILVFLGEAKPLLSGAVDREGFSKAVTSGEQVQISNASSESPARTPTVELLIRRCTPEGWPKAQILEETKRLNGSSVVVGRGDGELTGVLSTTVKSTPPPTEEGMVSSTNRGSGATSSEGANKQAKPIPPTSKTNTTSGPQWLISVLAGIPKLPLAKWGFAGWYQSSIDEAVLNDAKKAAREKVEALFGFTLAWEKFPKVVVKTVNQAETSRAKKNGVVAGDFLVNFSGEKISNVKLTLEKYRNAKSPEEAIVQKVQRALERLKRSGNYGKENLTGFVFLRKKYASQYLQLRVKVPNEVVGEDESTAAGSRTAERSLGFQVVSYKSNSLEMEILQVGKVLDRDAGKPDSFAVSNKLQQKDVLVCFNEKSLLSGAVDKDAFWELVSDESKNPSEAMNTAPNNEILLRRCLPEGWPQDQIDAETERLRVQM